jgi:tetratricopeptide (TPR) repeat protein
MIGPAVGGMLLAAGWMVWTAWRSADLRARAQSAASRADWDRTAKLLDRLSWYNPDDRNVLRLRVQAALGRGDLVVAARLLARVRSSAAEAVEARLAQGRLLIRAFLLREAEAAFRDCLRLDPKADEARLALIAILAVQRRGSDYETEAWALLKKGAEPIKALRLLAQAAPAIPPDTFTRTADMGDVLRRCLAADPDDPNTRVALAHFERNRGRIDEALRLLEPCLLHPDSNPRAVLEWAACLLDDGELDRLRSLFEHPADSVRGLGEFWLLRGEWVRRKGLETESLDNYREAIRLDPRCSEAYYRLGLALREAGPEATRCLEVSQKARNLKDCVARISDHSRDPDQLVRAGRICAEIGRYREARAWFSVALSTNPRHAEARAALETLDSEQAARRGDGPEPLSR